MYFRQTQFDRSLFTLPACNDGSRPTRGLDTAASRPQQGAVGLDSASWSARAEIVQHANAQQIKSRFEIFSIEVLLIVGGVLATCAHGDLFLDRGHAAPLKAIEIQQCRPALIAICCASRCAQLRRGHHDPGSVRARTRLSAHHRGVAIGIPAVICDFAKWPFRPRSHGQNRVNAACLTHGFCGSFLRADVSIPPLRINLRTAIIEPARQRKGQRFDATKDG